MEVCSVVGVNGNMVIDIIKITIFAIPRKTSMKVRSATSLNIRALIPFIIMLFSATLTPHRATARGVLNYGIFRGDCSHAFSDISQVCTPSEYKNHTK